MVSIPGEVKDPTQGINVNSLCNHVKKLLKK